MATIKLITTSEHWKAVPGFETKYMVSDLGQVCYMDNGKPKRLLKTRPTTTSKYLFVKLGNPRKGNRKTFSVHGLVMLAFVGPPSDGLQINHKDCNRYNNTLLNLEYVTSAYNRQHATLAGVRPSGDKHYCRLRPELIKKGVNHPSAKLSETDVIEIRRLASAGVSQYTIASIFKCSQSNINSIVKRIGWKHLVSEDSGHNETRLQG